jgi:uncharacterized protein
MAQNWHDLLFAHWPVSARVLRPLVPEGLELHTFEGQCWLAVTPFHMSGIRARGLPPLPGLSRFPELNVRTYVSFADKPGVYFFSLDAANSVAVWAARRLYALPYFKAEMRVEIRDDEISYISRRGDGKAEFRGQYHPAQGVELRQPGSLAHWLTERYCLYTVSGKQVYRAEIHHAPWPLQDAEAEIKINTMAEAAGITLPGTAPILDFARDLEVLIWPLRRIE